jgi:hypothetical protein
MPLYDRVRDYSEMKAALCKRGGDAVKEVFGRMSVKDFASGMNPDAWSRFTAAIVADLAKRGILEDVLGLSNRYARSILRKAP